ncbi:MAG: helix-turn-helix transcriptional regulator [Methylotenera sp. RIFCSPLOWO2_02_FULL_45_14]|nr:MAG: helix-turn-helix transcriptional regulator [Methylotenera sp. RIFCSPLOWO2_02_FULL_45_14]
MVIEINNKLWKNILSVIQHSYKIKTHLDFFKWVQNSVAAVIPHDVLVAAWGDFSDKSTGERLNYDVASNVEGINTRALWTALGEVGICAAHLHTQWVNNHRHWYVIDNLDDVASQCDFKTAFPSQLNGIHSILVYGVTDCRGENECLYVFLGKQKTFEVNGLAMSLLMPHIDHVLRKIQPLEPPDISENFSPVVNLSGLSAREWEVIEWIKTGKTNQEIGMILNISQNTVKSHLKRIFQKLNVGKRAQAVALLANLKSTKSAYKALNLTH